MDDIKVDSRTTETEIIDGETRVVEVTKYNALSWFLSKRNRIIVVVLLIIFLVLMFLTLGFISVLLPAIIKELTTKRHIEKAYRSTRVGEVWVFEPMHQISRELFRDASDRGVLDAAKKFYEFMGKSLMSVIVERYGYFEYDFIELIDSFAKYENSNEFISIHPDPKDDKKAVVLRGKEYVPEPRLDFVLAVFNKAVERDHREHPSMATYSWNENYEIMEIFLPHIIYLALLFKLRSLMGKILKILSPYNRADTYKFLEIYWFVLYELNLFIGDSGDKKKIKEIGDELAEARKRRGGAWWGRTKQIEKAVRRLGI